MCKNCNNCYWKYKFREEWCAENLEKPNENICKNYDYICCECNGESEYKYNGEHYCIDCLLRKFEVGTWTQTHYSINGEYLGSDKDMDEVIRKLSDEIESEEE